ncbi:MAG: TIGR00375 family protein, partial [Firmicutes bacterium]|nr:TIGR00375 family protein [Bacillota bacterium]
RPCRIDPCALASLSGDLGGFLIPAHAFTPHKGVLGAAVDRLSLIFGPLPADSVPALELGLSADTALADRIAEHSSLTFLSNSDAHSRASIGREFNLLCLAELSFAEIRRAVLGQDGRGVVANYGLDPELGKYRRSACLSCRRIASEPPPVQRCPRCGGPVVMGVDDRVSVIADRPPGGSPPHRPPYRHQVPFSFLPGVGAKAAARLTAAFGSERRALHEAAPDQLEAVVGKKTAAVILAARRGEIFLRAGGGGRYGKTVVKPSGPGP